MSIKLLRPDAENDYLFEISNQKKTYLTSIDYSNKSTCLEQLQTVLLDLRDNEQIAIQAGNNQQYYFEIAGLAQSPSFEAIEDASDVLSELKAFATASYDFSVSYEKPNKKVVSKKKIGGRTEAYNFEKKSIHNQPGFELIDIEDSKDKYFHFNDANGKPILYSRVYEGKTRRLKAIHSIIHQTNTSKNVEVVKQDGHFFFIFKTEEDYEIARSKSFKSRGKMEVAMVYLTAEAPNYEADFKIPKKKKKKRKSNEKYHLKQASPLGLIGFESFKSAKNKLHYFHYNDKKGQPLLFSKPFNKRRNRDEYITKILALGTQQKGYKTWKKSKNQFYFSIIEGNEKSFARSRYYSTEKKMLAALKAFKADIINHKEAVNKVTISKKKKYTITLPEKSIPVVTKGLIKETVATSIPVITAVSPIEKPDVLPDILPQPSIKIEREIVPTTEIIEEEVSEETTIEIIEEEVVEEEVVATYTTPVTEIEEEEEEEEEIQAYIPTFKEETTTIPAVKPSPSIAPKIASEKSKKGFPWWWVLLGLLGLFLLGLLFKKCNTEKAVVTPPPTPKVVAKPRPKPVAPAKLGPTALDLNLTSNTAEARIADFLSTPKLAVPKTFVLESVQFPFNSAELTATSLAQLDNVARVLTAYPKAKIEVNGHTDSRGEDVRNMILSQNRANAVQAYLIGKEIATTRILKAVGFGETSPISDNNSEEGMQENRRSEIVLVER
ncbi:MAG: OmpA family protein [Saprospiraceae bacterium]